MKELGAVQGSFLNDFLSVFTSMNKTYSVAYDALKTKDDQIEKLEEDVRKLQDTMTLLNQENSELNGQLLELRQHLRTTMQDLSRYRDMNNNDSKRANYPPFDTSGVLSSPSFDNGNQSSKAALKRSGSAGSLSISSPNFMRPRTPSRTQSAREEAYVAAGFLSDDGSNSIRSPRADLNTPRKGPMSLVAPSNWLRSFREDVQKVMDDPNRCRIISLKECLEMIEKVYDSKTIANEKAAQGIGNVPMETMEQHFFRMMEKKYGLRDLAAPHAAILLKALQVYAPEDNSVAVFQCIFRNEIEEDFRFVQKELHKSIKDLIGIKLMGKYPSKDQASVAAMVEQKMTSGFILEEEWSEIMTYLYNEVDTQTVCSVLRKHAVMEKDLESGPAVMITSPPVGSPGPSNRAQSPSATPRSAGTMSPYYNLPTSQIGQNKIKQPAGYKIGTPSTAYHSADPHKAGTIGYDRSKVRDVRRLGYSSPSLHISTYDPNKQKSRDKLRLAVPTFIKLVLDYQLQSHREFLSNFSKVFHHVDRNTDGVLSAKEFHTFYSILRRVSEDSSVLATILQRPVTSVLDSQGEGRHFDFHEVDQNGSQSVTSEEEMHTLLAIIKMLDPHQTDRITFSSAVAVLNHIQTGKFSATASDNGSTSVY